MINRRTGAVPIFAAAALGITGCSHTGFDGSSDNTMSTVASDSPAQSTQAQSLTSGSNSSSAEAQCHTDNLELSASEIHGAAGSKEFSVVFKNTGTSSCTLEGFPGVSLVTDNNGTQLGEPAEREEGVKASPVTLPAGGSAEAPVTLTNVGVLDPESCQPTPADGLRVYPPNETASAFIKIEGLEGCKGKDKILTVLPVAEG